MARTKAGRKRPATRTKAKPTKRPVKLKAKTKPKPKPKSRPKAKPKRTAMPRIVEAAVGIEPLQLVETKPGKFSLLLTRFDPAGATFAAAGVEGGGHAWEAVARHSAPHLVDRVSFDPEATMFCAYGSDRVALEELGACLSALFRDQVALAEVIGYIGPAGFLD